ncbi:MAG: hypothetical protein ABJN36_17620 [Cyclobacteriaceae bacterium]
MGKPRGRTVIVLASLFAHFFGNEKSVAACKAILRGYGSKTKDNEGPIRPLGDQEPMNFIKHYLSVMNKITEDNRLHATHVSLYISLFTLWNLNRFENPISINREEVMKISKIGSRNTYHKCLKELDQFGYLEYLPSHNPLKGSLVNMLNFDTTPVQALGNTSPKNDTSSVQALSPSLNSNKHLKQSNTHVNKNFNEPL